MEWLYFSIASMIYIPIVLGFFGYIITGVYHTIKIKSNRYPSYEQSLYTLQIVINNYQARLISKINSLRKIAETNTEKYNKDFQEVVNANCKLVLTDISPESKEVLLTHFSNDGLLTYIRVKLIELAN